MSLPLYTVCDEDTGYEVIVCRSFAALWETVRNDDMYLAPDNEKALTKAGLKRDLKETGEARIYKADDTDWRMKIQSH